MSLQKLENYSNKAVVQEEVLILTELLEDITKNMLAPETFEKIMQLKELSTQEDYQGLNQLVTSLTNDEMAYISRYFSILPLLINISEDVDLAYEINIKIISIKIILGNYQQQSKWLQKKKMRLKF